MKAALPLSLLSLAVSATGVNAGEDASVKITIGDTKPYYHACYEAARNGDSSADSVEPCDRSLEEEPLTQRNQAILYANRGVIHYNIGDYESAVEDFTVTLELGIHDEARLYVNRGLAFEVLGWEALARADYQAALAVNSAHPLAKRRLEELEKPLYERSRIPRRITAEYVDSTGK